MLNFTEARLTYTHASCCLPLLVHARPKEYSHPNGCHVLFCTAAMQPVPVLLRRLKDMAFLSRNGIPGGLEWRHTCLHNHVCTAVHEEKILSTVEICTHRLYTHRFEFGACYTYDCVLQHQGQLLPGNLCSMMLSNAPQSCFVFLYTRQVCSQVSCGWPASSRQRPPSPAP